MDVATAAATAGPSRGSLGMSPPPSSPTPPPSQPPPSRSSPSASPSSTTVPSSPPLSVVATMHDAAFLGPEDVVVHPSVHYVDAADALPPRPLDDAIGDDDDDDAATNDFEDASRASTPTPSKFLEPMPPPPPPPPSDVLFAGYLRKRYSSSLYMGSWRYCIVRHGRLRWYMTPELAQQDRQLRGEIEIQGVEPWDGQGSMNLYPHAFAIRTTSNRVLLCSAKSDEERARWLQNLTKAASLGKPPRRQAPPQQHQPYHHPLDGPNSVGLSLTHHLHGPEPAERRRVVPEDAVRAQASKSDAPLYAATEAHAAWSEQPRLTSPRHDFAPSFVSSVSDIDLAGLTHPGTECARCAVRFGTFVARRVVCHSCHQAFCSRHCNRPVKLHHLGARSSRRCCARCARRQEFLLYLGTVADFMTSLAVNPLGTIALATQKMEAILASSTSQRHETHDRMIEKLRKGPMSLIKTVKILYQTRQTPSIFCVACERLPYYVENCIDRVENLWYQILHLFQCCDTELDSFSLQLFCLKRFIGAVCRRSPRIALQTIWHVQAAMEDSSRHHPNSLLSLLGFLYPPSVNCKVWTELLLADCPEHQRTQILASLSAVHAKCMEVIAKEPDSVIERWLRASTIAEFEQAASELSQSGIRLCEFQTSIAYESLQNNIGNTQSTLEDIVTDQVQFVQSLAAISERLRHIQPVEERGNHLGTELKQLNDCLSASALYPLCAASDELFKVVRIPPNEGKVFSTKMRAPTLIFLETIPVDATNLVGSEDERLLPFMCSSQRGNQTFVEAPPLEDQDTHRDSLNSVPDSSAGTSIEVTPTKQRHGSQLSCQDDLDTMSNSTDDDFTTPKNESGPFSSILGRHMTFPRDSTHNRPDAYHSNPGPGFSLTSLTHSARLQHAMENIVYDSKVFGESWETRKERIRMESPHGHLPGWQLFSVIVKTNDDLRQEMFTMQLVNKFKSIFEIEKLNLWLRTYRIVATGANIGLLETINDACSLDHLKKTFKGGNMCAYFRCTFGEPSSSGFELAKQNFIHSMAAYSIVSYVLLVKDRHNGNILLSSAGHIIHIDFGFILGIAPGGMFSIEDAPFKLTAEMVEIMGGLHSPGFSLYRSLLVDGFCALHKYQSEIVAMLQTTGQHSPFPCFEGAKLARVVNDLRGRLCVGLTRRQVEKRVDHLIKKSFNNWGTRQYDAFQLRSNNIQP